MGKSDGEPRFRHKIAVCRELGRNIDLILDADFEPNRCVRRGISLREDAGGGALTKRHSRVQDGQPSLASGAAAIARTKVWANGLFHAMRQAGRCSSPEFSGRAIPPDFGHSLAMPLHAVGEHDFPARNPYSQGRNESLQPKKRRAARTCSASKPGAVAPGDGLHRLRPKTEGDRIGRQ